MLSLAAELAPESLETNGNPERCEDVVGLATACPTDDEYAASVT